MTFGPARRPAEERFWSKVDKNGDDQCWLWMGGKTTKGYGTFMLHPGKLVMAHRYAYESVHGPILSGLEIDHRRTCPKNCVRPDHLRPATHKQNQENRGVQSNNTSGARGVTWDRKLGRWKGQFQHYGRNHYVGLFDTVEAAAAAVRARRVEVFTHSDADLVSSLEEQGR